MGYDLLGELKTDEGLIGGFPFERKGITLALGENLKRYAVLGKVSPIVDSVTPATNTGDGTVTDVSVGPKVQPGDYELICTATAADGGTFQVYDPEGGRLKDAAVGTPYAGSQINFTINDGATDFDIGDSFTITIAKPASDQYKQVDKDATDGTQHPVAILARDTDATSATQKTVAFFTGKFNENALLFKAGQTIEDFREALNERHLFTRPSAINS